MKLQMKEFLCLILCFLALNNYVFAAIPKGHQYHVAVAPTKTPGHFELLGGIGLATLNATNSNLGVTSSETDKLVQTNNDNWNAFTGQLGAGYVYYFRHAQRYSERAQWFPSIEPELNLYFLGSNTIRGDVWRFRSPNFNQLTYAIPVRSTRLMLDGALTIVSKKKFSLYAIGGIGNAWNRVSYSDTDSGTSCLNQRLNLNSNNLTNFAWELGAGLTYAFNNRVGLSLEYLYTDLGKVRSSAVGTSGTITTPIIVPAYFRLSSQAGLLGLHLAL